MSTGTCTQKDKCLGRWLYLLIVYKQQVQRDATVYMKKANNWMQRKWKMFYMNLCDCQVPNIVSSL